MERPFSTAWTLLSIALFLGIELLIGTLVGPAVLGKYVSPMFHLQLQMTMHLVSFWLGGLMVGLLSPGLRLTEPAVGAFASVGVVFTVSFFMPNWFYRFDLSRMMIGAAIAVGLALLGAYAGEKWMGNIAPDDEEANATARGRLRSRLWNADDGYLVPGRGRDDRRD